MIIIRTANGCEFINDEDVTRITHNKKVAQLLKSRTIKLNKLENAIIDDDLFHFESQDHEKRKQNVRNEIEQLNRDEYQIDEFPEYINKIKLWI